jgi:hypothetical protein
MNKQELKHIKYFKIFYKIKFVFTFDVMDMIN